MELETVWRDFRRHVRFQYFMALRALNLLCMRKRNSATGSGAVGGGSYGAPNYERPAGGIMPKGSDFRLIER